jgi:hypothetical protein
MKILDELMRRPELLAELSKEQLTMLLGLVQEEKLKTKGWQSQMAEAVDDQLVQGLVKDFRNSRPGPGILSPEQGAAKSSFGVKKGYVEPAPLTGSIPGIRQLDDIAEHFAELDKKDLKKRLGGG